MIERITILGGSSVYTPELILSLIARNVNVQEIALLGRPGRKLELVSQFCQRIIDKSGYPCKVIGTADPAEAIPGARYILNHIRVGGMAARMRDEMLPPKMGMLGDETLGAGGIANAMRTLPVIFEIAETIEKLNPNATVINLSNPIGILIEGLIRHTKLNVFGLCDLPGTYVRKVTNVLQLDANQLRVEYIGLNHLGWIQDVKVADRSKMSQLLDLLDENKDDGFDHELISLFRMIPTRNTGLFFHRADIVKRQQSGTRFRAEILHEAEQQILKLYEDPHLNEVPDLTRQRNAVWYKETIVPVLEALEGDADRDAVLCVRNNGSIRDLPDDSSVEIPATISKKGIRPRKVGSLPRFLKGVFLATKESDRLTVEAVVHKSYDYALQALTINPFVPSLETAKRFLDRIIREEKLELH